MHTAFSRRLSLQLFAVACTVLATACAALDHGVGAVSNPAGHWHGQTVYSRVGMRVEPGKLEPGWHMYSTNHIGLLKHIPAGTEFTAHDAGFYTIELTARDGSMLKLEFVARHHPDLTFDSWLDRQLSKSPVELPGGLRSSEREAIDAGRYEVGMSRKSLFLSIGFPPATLSPNLEDSVLSYETKRFNRIVFTFDEKDRISSIRH